MRAEWITSHVKGAAWTMDCKEKGYKVNFERAGLRVAGDLLQPSTMQTSPRTILNLSRQTLCCGLLLGHLLTSLPAFGQKGAVTFKHFKTYPSGQWAQEIQAYRNGAPAGAPERSTTCASPLSAAQAANATKMGNDAAPMCTMKVLKDEERVAEYEQTCTIGPQEQVVHSTMRAIDDRTIAIEVRNSIGVHEMSFARITSRYTGACTPEQATPQMPTMPNLPKPSSEYCAGVPEMKRQVEETTKGCASEEMPAGDRANCIAAMQRLSNNVKLMETQCKGATP